MSNNRLLRSARSGITWVIDLDAPRRQTEQAALMARIERGELVDLGSADAAENPTEF